MPCGTFGMRAGGCGVLEGGARACENELRGSRMVMNNVLCLASMFPDSLAVYASVEVEPYKKQLDTALRAHDVLRRSTPRVTSRDRCRGLERKITPTTSTSA
ncbi:hypothetical protein BDQ17DRAFT_1427934 [Cyathus striatus]|nr:hypothetical protein BDQ17DRAFT_1427934 [Cyathus striatus]